MEGFIRSLADLGVLQWSALLSGVLYVLLAARQNAWCWIWGAVSTLLSAFVFYQNRLYSDTLLQIYYLAVAVYGWISWRRGTQENRTLAVSSRPAWFHATAILGSFILSALLGSFWEQFDAALPYVDALLAALSILATWMTTRKIAECWIYWILIDLAYTIVYAVRDLPLFAVLYAIYTGIAVHAYIQWKRSAAKSPDPG